MARTKVFKFKKISAEFREIETLDLKTFSENWNPGSKNLPGKLNLNTVARVLGLKLEYSGESASTRFQQWREPKLPNSRDGIRLSNVAKAFLKSNRSYRSRVVFEPQENDFTAIFTGKHFPSQEVKWFSPENDFPLRFLPNNVK